MFLREIFGESERDLYCPIFHLILLRDLGKVVANRVKNGLDFLAWDVNLSIYEKFYNSLSSIL